MATILVVDDHLTNREFLVTLLGYSGHRLLEAADGAEALAVVRTEQPDLVIVDLVMPTMDGYEFVHQLRTDPAIAQTQVIFCTATYLQSEAWTLAQACGVRHIIAKPAEPEVVLKIVAEALDLADTRTPSLSSAEFHREHLRVLTDKLSKQVAALEQEVAERKLLEEALQRERDLLEVTLTSIGDGVITTNQTGALTFLNPMAEMLTGWTAAEAKGRNANEIFHLINAETQQRTESPVEKVLREGRVVDLADHVALLARDGKEIPISDSGAPIRNKNGQVEGVVVVFRDITDRKRVEVALIAAKEAAEATDRIKTEFLATMSHELRTPLNVILGYVELLRDGSFGELPPHHDKILQRMEQNARVLSELITMVLDLNRLEAGGLPVVVKDIRLVNLFQEIKEEMQGLCDQSGLSFVWKVEDGLPIIQTDPGKLKVILKNLIGNAIKFTTKGSVVINAYPHANGVEISVTDTGIGIPQDAYFLIFEPFRQVDSSDTRLYTGSGLGLHIVKRLLDLLEGTVTVDSQIGQGSTFRVRLPRHPFPSEEKDSQ
ncbi:MAG: ATP-binding protein [Candidatus Binatia bacterium]